MVGLLAEKEHGGNNNNTVSHFTLFLGTDWKKKIKIKGDADSLGEELFYEKKRPNFSTDCVWWGFHHYNSESLQTIAKPPKQK